MAFNKFEGTTKYLNSTIFWKCNTLNKAEHAVYHNTQLTIILNDNLIICHAIYPQLECKSC